FWFMWDDLVHGAIGAVVLVDTRRLDDSFAAVDFFEARNLPFLIAVNEFDDSPTYSIEELREALSVSPNVPIINVDARQRDSAKNALIAITSFALERLPSSAF
ncbi:GTP-binding protein, partial [Mycolicibacterium conceptionense]